MSRPKLYLHHLVKGEQNVEIGDNIKQIIDIESFKDRMPLTKNTNFDNEIGIMARSLQIRDDIIKGGGEMIKERLYVCSPRGIILGIIVLN